MPQFNDLRGLIMDMVRQANSGHTGGPLSSLDFAGILFRDILRYNPDDPDWINRDRFVLAAGHESALLYTMLYLLGYLEMDDLRKFRQLNSRTPGHPEHDLTPGVDATSGPLGQGVASAIGMAVAESMLNDRLGADVIDHFTYCLCGDGDLQEPVSLGAAELAGHWGLGKLIMFYDCNRVQISGTTDRVDSTDIPALFDGMGWHVIKIDGHDHDAIQWAIDKARGETHMPTIIVGETVMAHGTATMEGSPDTHGAPLPHEEIAATKTNLGLDPGAKFAVADETVAAFRERQPDLVKAVGEWRTRLDKRKKNLEFRQLWQVMIEQKWPEELPLPNFKEGESIATRKAFGEILEAIADSLPGLVGGSADLEPSNNTAGFAKTYGDFNRENRGGRSLAYGVREFPMGAINNGIALHGGLMPFGATFLVFTDYERPALRMRALQKLWALGVYTHDSVFLGEDGPTHQPIEQTMSLRLMPGMKVYRPADAVETAACMAELFKRKHEPAVLLLSRQGLPVPATDQHKEIAAGVTRGAYIRLHCSDNPAVVIYATGSEVNLATEVANQLADLAVRIISIPCWEIFNEQSDKYHRSILDVGDALRVSIEAGATIGWERFTGLNGLNIGIDRFGASGPGQQVAEYLGLSVEAIRNKIMDALTP